MPWLGVNAAVHILNFVGQSFDDQLAKDLYHILQDWQGKPVGIYKNGLYMSFLTMNTGIVDIEDGKTRILIDIRYPNDTDAKTIMEGFDATCASLSSNIHAIMESDSKPLLSILNPSWLQI